MIFNALTYSIYTPTIYNKDQPFICWFRKNGRSFII